MLKLNGRDILLTIGDTGVIGFRPDKPMEADDRAVLTVRRPRGGAPVLEMVSRPDEEGLVRFVLENKDTAKLRPDCYIWDVRFVLDAQVGVDGRITGGREVITPFPPGEFRLVKGVGEIG